MFVYLQKYEKVKGIKESKYIDIDPRWFETRVRHKESCCFLSLINLFVFIIFLVKKL